MVFGSHTQYISVGYPSIACIQLVIGLHKESLDNLDCAVNLDGDDEDTEPDGYWNRAFTAGDANTSQTLSSLLGTCEFVPLQLIFTK